MDQRFEKLGAHKFYPSGFADDATGLELVVEPWMDGLFPALRGHLDIDSPVESNQIEQLAATNVINTDSTDCANAIHSNSITPNTVVNGIISDEDRTNVVDDSSHDSLPNSNSNRPIRESVTIRKETNISDVTDSSPKSPTDMTNNIKSSTIIDFSAEKTTLNEENTTADSEIQQNVSQQEIIEDLTHSLPPLSESSLNLPLCPPRLLKATFLPDKHTALSDLPLHNEYPFPSAKSTPKNVNVVAAHILTRHDAVKKAVKISLDISETDWQYEPGDSFGIVCRNNDEETQTLLDRLNVGANADTTCQLSVIEGTKKRNPAVPAFLPPEGTLRHWFLTCCDIRSVPKKALLRALAEHTTHPQQKRRLQELSSKQGAEHFTKYVREPGLGVLDVLIAFPLCCPPVEIFLENLPRLQPRPYSAASFRKTNDGCVDIVFNIVEIPGGCHRYRARKGICTGWLEKLVKPLHSKSISEDIAEQMKDMNITENIQIPVFPRSNQHFHPHEDLAPPVIMVGPGTGVAPFIGFLQYRDYYKKQLEDTSTVGESWLFYGCRHKERDYLFRNELEEFQRTGTLNHLHTCFSRDSADDSTPHYVQDNIRIHSSTLFDLIMEKGVQIYVCGDAKGMAKDVRRVFIDIIQAGKGCTTKEAESYIIDMVIGKRYHEDVWT